MSNFSRRIKDTFDKEFNLFKSEFKLIYDKLANEWKQPLFNDLKLIIKSGYSSGNPFEVASTIEYKNGIFEVTFNKDAVDYALNRLIYNNKPVYKSRENIIKNAACHEACHLLLAQMHIDPKENGLHRSMFRSIYEPLRVKYTDVPFVVSIDGKRCNFIDEGNIKNVFRDNFSMSR